MPFNLDALMDDPQFQMGIGLLGSAGGPYTGLLKAYEVMQQRNAARIQAEERQRELAMHEQRMQIERARMEQYAEQTRQQRRKLDMEERQQQEAMKALPGILGSFGIQSGESQTEVPPTTPTITPVTPTPPVESKPLGSAPTLGNDLFSMADSFVEKVEGGKTVDTGGETNHGIAKKYNPDLDPNNLTAEQGRAVRKERYWDIIAPKISKLSPEAQVIAYDAAINQGVNYMSRMLRETNGIPSKMLDHRRKKYEYLVEKNPKKYGAYQDGWGNRLEQLEDYIASLEPPKLAAVTGTPEKQAASTAKNVQLASASQAPRLSPNDPAVAIAKSQIASGKVTEGLNTLAQASKAAKEAARQAQRDAQRDQIDNQRLNLSQEQLRLQQSEAVARQQERAAAATAKQEEAAARKAEAATKRTAEQATALKSYQTTDASLSNLREKTTQLLQNKNTPFIFGLQGVVPVIPGTGRADAKALHTSVVKQIAQETLQAIRQASPTGGALGNVSDKDIQLLETSLRNLERAQSWPAAQKQLQEVLRYVDKIQSGYKQHYETLYGPLPKQAAAPAQPAAATNNGWSIRRIK